MKELEQTVQQIVDRRAAAKLLAAAIATAARAGIVIKVDGKALHQCAVEFVEESQ